MRRFFVFFLIVILFSFPSSVSADVAPPAQPPGSNLQPGDGATQVQMKAETVLIDVQPTAPSKSLGQAHVTASFTMQDMGGAPESMAVRFPVAANDGFFNISQIKDLHVKVDGKTVRTRDILGEDPYGGNDQVPWVEFDVNFPPGQEVNIEVAYTLEAAGEYPFVWFKYVFSTGAGWKDSIGQADLIVRLPYPASGQNVLFNPVEPVNNTTPGGVISGNEIRWHYADLEPTTDNNFEVDLVMPSAWEKVLIEQDNVKQNPNDGEAWGRLGKLYKETAFSSRGKGFRTYPDWDPGGKELYQLSVAAYEKSVSLKPDDPLWHAGFADLLAYHAYFLNMDGVDATQEMVRALQEIRRALDLAPDDPKVQEIATEISYDFPDGMVLNGASYDYPWLTSTPLPPTPFVEALLATDTPVPELLSTPTAPALSPTVLPPASDGTHKPSSGSPLYVCGVPVGLLGAFFLVQRKGKRSGI